MNRAVYAKPFKPATTLDDGFISRHESDNFYYADIPIRPQPSSNKSNLTYLPAYAEVTL